MTASQSSFEQFESDDWRSNKPNNPNEFKVELSEEEKLFIEQSELTDANMPNLDENTIWWFQRQLESFIRRNAPGQMGTRNLALLRLLCGQARRHSRLK